MKVWKYGDNINTDVLFPGKYTYTCNKPEEMIPHLLEDLDPDFAQNVRKGDIILAGKNFGCGSSREQPVIGLKSVGIQAIIAISFARIFYRSAINQGLLLIECPKAVKVCQEGDSIKINAAEGSIQIGSQLFTFPKLPPQIIRITESDGLLEYTRKKLRTRKKKKEI
jgi:3-isopropylmalate/(R)-2-methylmalate dehydratase small subunit